MCAVLRCLAVLVPDATPRYMKRIANKILTLTDGKDRNVRITQEQARELILPHLQCIKDDCPQLAFGNRSAGRSTYFSMRRISLRVEILREW